MLQTGIGVIDENQIYLSVFQQIHTADGSTVGDFDVDTGKGLVEPA